MTRGSVARVIDAGGYTEHVRERLAGVTVAVVEVDTSHVVAGLERLVAAGDLRAVLCHADGQGPCVASCCPIKGQRAPAVCRPVHQHPPSTPETTGTAPQGDRAAGGDCLIPRGGERPSHGGGETRPGVLSRREVGDLLAAIRDPDYVRRVIEDARVDRLVEVDNPFRRETRPRRGLAD